MNKLLRNIRTQAFGLVEVVGFFRPNAGSAISVYGGIGVKAVTRKGTGSFEIELEDSYVELMHADLQVRLASAAATFAQLGAVDLSTKKILVTTLSTTTTAAPAAADIAANAGNIVYFRLVFRTSAEKL